MMIFVKYYLLMCLNSYKTLISLDFNVNCVMADSKRQHANKKLKRKKIDNEYYYFLFMLDTSKTDSIQSPKILHLTINE